MTSLVSFSVTTDTEASPPSSRRASITHSPDSASEPAWSWVVLAGSFLCLSVLDGISYTFGMLLGPLMEALQCGRSSVSAAGSLQVDEGHENESKFYFIFSLEVAVYSITGVLAARLVTRYGARAVCVTGALVSASGLILASYSSSLAALLLTYSLVTGLGFGETLHYHQCVTMPCPLPRPDVHPCCGGGGGALPQAAVPGHGDLRVRHRGGHLPPGPGRALLPQQVSVVTLSSLSHL